MLRGTYGFDVTSTGASHGVALLDRRALALKCNFCLRGGCSLCGKGLAFWCGGLRIEESKITQAATIDPVVDLAAPEFDTSRIRVKNDYNPRERKDPEALRALAGSIADIGVIGPLVEASGNTFIRSGKESAVEGRISGQCPRRSRSS